VVSIGKRLSKDLYVVYERGTGGRGGRVAAHVADHTEIPDARCAPGYFAGVDAVYRWTFE
jgi:hypothetical protein